MNIQFATATHVGKRRKNNEDTVFAAGYPDIDAAMLVVADGMGGAPVGEVASHTAADQFTDVGAEGLGFDTELFDDAVFAALGKGFEQANAEILELVANHPEWAGMGTTLVVAWIRSRHAWIGNVGDSRAYLIRNGEIEQLTTDHSYVDEEIRAGRLASDEAGKSQYRHILTRAVGTEQSIVPDLIGPRDLNAGDTLLICSDGLHGTVSDADIAEIASGTDPAKATRALIKAANRSGGPDNVSAAIARIS